MSDKFDTFDDVLALWKTPGELSEALGCQYVTAQVMRHRKSIGDDHWDKLIKAAALKGVSLTNDDLLAMKRRRKAERAAGQVAA